VDGNVIELTDLTKQYGSFTAVDQLNLTIHEGEIFGLLGPNGAGKSTTILMMLGLTEPTSGSVKVCGINSTTNPINVKKIVGYLPEDIGFYDELTGMENLMYWRVRDAEDGERMLMYLLGHESVEAAKESFAAFRSDPEWQAVKQDSEGRAGGSLTVPDKGVLSVFLVPTEYSPLK